MSCAPTAAASSLAWFDDDEDCAAILPDGWTNKDLVDRIGEFADTDNDGSDAPDLADAIEEAPR